MAQRWPLLLGAMLGLAALLVALTQPVSTPDQWQMAARLTARAGFPLLIIAYIARPLVQLWPHPVSRAMLARRRWFGLGFAASHSVHLLALVLAIRLSDEGVPAATLIGGGIGYAILYAMALTSNSAAMHALGKWWKRLHRLGIHYLWFIFAFSYLGRIFDPERATIGYLFFTVAIAAALVRLAAWIKIRKRSA